jgi:hypothetical protein
MMVKTWLGGFFVNIMKNSHFIVVKILKIMMIIVL